MKPTPVATVIMAAPGVAGSERSVASVLSHEAPEPCVVPPVSSLSSGVAGDSTSRLADDTSPLERPYEYGCPSFRPPPQPDVIPARMTTQRLDPSLAPRHAAAVYTVVVGPTEIDRGDSHRRKQPARAPLSPSGTPQPTHDIPLEPHRLRRRPRRGRTDRSATPPTTNAAIEKKKT